MTMVNGSRIRKLPPRILVGGDVQPTDEQAAHLLERLLALLAPSVVLRSLSLQHFAMPSSCYAALAMLPRSLEEVTLVRLLRLGFTSFLLRFNTILLGHGQVYNQPAGDHMIGHRKPRSF